MHIDAPADILNIPYHSIGFANLHFTCECVGILNVIATQPASQPANPATTEPADSKPVDQGTIGFYTREGVYQYTHIGAPSYTPIYFHTGKPSHGCRNQRFPGQRACCRLVRWLLGWLAGWVAGWLLGELVPCKNSLLLNHSFTIGDPGAVPSCLNDKTVHIIYKT